MKQTYEKLELILMDDGSPEQCGKIFIEIRFPVERIHDDENSFL